jgi:hypothetical protein
MRSIDPDEIREIADDMEKSSTNTPR